MAVLYGIGIGPGDPELLTIKAVRVIKAAPVIAVPKAKGEGRSLALERTGTVIDLRGKEVMELVFPMKKERKGLIKYWEQARDRVIKTLQEGKDIAFLTIGDPLFHSTFIYLMEYVEADSRFQCPDNQFSITIVPGVSSIHASSAAAGIPLASSHESVAVLPATYESAKLREALINFDTIVLIKVYKVINKVVNILTELCLKDKAIFILKAGWPEEEVVRDMDELKGKELDYFSLVIIKK